MAANLERLRERFVAGAIAWWDGLGDGRMADIKHLNQHKMAPLRAQMVELLDHDHPGVRWAAIHHVQRDDPKLALERLREFEASGPAFIVSLAGRLKQQWEMMHFGEDIEVLFSGVVEAIGPLTSCPVPALAAHFDPKYYVTVAVDTVVPADSDVQPHARKTFAIHSPTHTFVAVSQDDLIGQRIDFCLKACRLKTHWRYLDLTATDHVEPGQ